jgi:hypothetical protein
MLEKTPCFGGPCHLHLQDQRLSQAACSSEILGFLQTTKHYNPEDPLFEEHIPHVGGGVNVYGIHIFSFCNRKWELVRQKKMKTYYLIPLGGSQCTLNELEVIEFLSNVTFSGRRGTVRYWAVVGADISSSLRV